MKAIILLSLTFTFLLAFTSASNGQIISVYSVIDYDANTNTLDGYAYTQPSYEAGVYYSVTTSASIRNDSYSLLGTQSQTKTDGSWATVEMIVPGNGCQFYTISTDHIDHEEYYLYYVDGWWQDGWYDPYNFYYFEGNQPEEPYWQSTSFFGPGPERIKSVNLENQTYLGNTIDVSSGSCNLAPEVTITKADGSALPNPLRLGKTGTSPYTSPSPAPTPIDRTQHLKATVNKRNQATSVTINVSGKITKSNVSANNSTGIITFDVVGNSASSTAGDSTITATYPGVGTPLVTKYVSVVIPSKIGTPHDTSGVYSAANLALDATTQPAAQGLPAGKVLLATVYMRWLTINVWDQFDTSIGDIYSGAPVAEVLGGTTYYGNDTITSSGTYLDPTGLEVDNDDRVDAGSTEATTWYGQPKIPIPVTGRTGTQNITVKIDGFTLNPSIVSRTWTASPPNTLTISWPN